jgi:hypothetical protein
MFCHPICIFYFHELVKLPSTSADFLAFIILLNFTFLISNHPFNLFFNIQAAPTQGQAPLLPNYYQQQPYYPQQYMPMPGRVPMPYVPPGGRGYPSQGGVMYPPAASGRGRGGGITIVPPREKKVATITDKDGNIIDLKSGKIVTPEGGEVEGVTAKMSSLQVASKNDAGSSLRKAAEEAIAAGGAKKLKEEQEKLALEEAERIKVEKEKAEEEARKKEEEERLERERFVLFS